MLFAVAAVLVYIAGLMCSHLAAFRIATNLRLAMTKHIATLPLGAIEQFGSGKLRRTISETAGATETYLAHQLPDKAKAMATIAGLLALLLIFDWRLGLLSLVPVALAFAVMTSMTGKRLQDKMTQYQNALADMSNEAVEYVRGIPVVKTFGQTVFSFKKFKGTIDNYERWVIAYTKQLRWPMTLLYAGDQQRVCVPDRRRLPVLPRRSGWQRAAESALLHHHHAGHLSDADQADVHERERHDRAGCHHPH